MNRRSVLLLIVVFLLTACSGYYHPEYVGDYYVCKREGKLLSETDSIHQVYLRLNADHTYQIKDGKSTEFGGWKAKDSDDYQRIFFYPTYTDYFFDNPAGETSMNYLPKTPEAVFFREPLWYDPEKRDAYESTKLLFCKQGNELTPEQIMSEYQ